MNALSVMIYDIFLKTLYRKKKKNVFMIFYISYKSYVKIIILKIALKESVNKMVKKTISV